MTHGDDYELSRLAYSEWNEQFKNSYVSVRDQKPNFVWRLLAALPGSLGERASKSVERGKVDQTRTSLTK